MKIPAIRINLGIWKYYVSFLSFEQVAKYVKKIDDELHKSKHLQDLIQRSITKNYLDIKDYILGQKEMFFNSLVLAVYDGDPKWIEVELSYKEEEFFNLGFLDFNGKEKIFPVDGQHRVEGIKAALLQQPSLKNEKIACLFIGHKKDKKGMEISRRLFTTLNRYAKPVTCDDIISLDEDDCAAIVTRELLEDFPLFNEKRIIKAKQKAIPENNKVALTSIITLYQCNREILKTFLYFKKKKDTNFVLPKMNVFLKYRPKEMLLDEYRKYVLVFWKMFSSKFSDIDKYLHNTDSLPAKLYRNKEKGGNLLFRPVGLLPCIQAITLIKKRNGDTFGKIISGLNKNNLNMDKKPWMNVLWDPINKKMIMGSNEIVKLMLIFLYDKSILKEREISKLSSEYANKISYKGSISRVLDTIFK